MLGCCRDEPVIPEPEVHGGIPVDGFSCLLLYTRSLWQAVLESTGATDPDLVIAQLCRNYFRYHRTITFKLKHWKLFELAPIF